MPKPQGTNQVLKLWRSWPNVERVHNHRHPKGGGKIRNADIAQKLGVSSIPVREALRLLEKEELILFRPGRGTWLASVSSNDLKETVEMREILDTFAVGL